MKRGKILDLLKNLYRVSWKTKFNELDSYYTEKVLDLCCEYESLKEKLVDNDYVKIYKIKDEMSKLHIYKEDKEMLVNKLKFINDEYEEIKENINHASEILEDRMCKILSTLEKYTDEMLEKIQLYIQDYKDVEVLIKRTTFFQTKMTQTLLSLNGSSIFDYDLLDDILKKLKNIMSDILHNTFSKKNETTIQVEESEKVSYSKIFNPREMIRLAEDNGYIKTRTAGDHVIMLHGITNKIISIPYHNLGYGLMIKIQKQILNNKVLA